MDFPYLPGAVNPGIGKKGELQPQPADNVLLQLNYFRSLLSYNRIGRQPAF